MDEGWIKAHRKMKHNPVVNKDSDHIAVWMYLLLNATHKEYPALFKGKKVILEPGQLITGRKSIAAFYKISESKVQRILKTFESEQQIEQQKSNQNRLITILSWCDYQLNEQQNEQQVNNERTTSEQRVNTNKNVKNGKNEKKKNIGEIEDFFARVWNKYPKGFKKGKVSQKQKRELYKLGEDVLMTCIDRYINSKPDWQTFKNASTFFNSGYLDYMDGTYEEQENTKDNWRDF